MSQSSVPEFGKITVDPSWKIAIVRSVWHGEMTSSLVKDAVAGLVEAGIKNENIGVIDAPGSYEIPLLCQAALEAGADGAIAFGIIVQGATHHARLIAEESARGIMDIQLRLKKPITYEVLFVNNEEDARARSIGPGAKGRLAATTFLSSLAHLKELS